MGEGTRAACARQLVWRQGTTKRLRARDSDGGKGGSGGGGGGGGGGRKELNEDECPPLPFPFFINQLGN